MIGINIVLAFKLILEYNLPIFRSPDSHLARHSRDFIVVQSIALSIVTEGQSSLPPTNVGISTPEDAPLLTLTMTQKPPRYTPSPPEPLLRIVLTSRNKCLKHPTWQALDATAGDAPIVTMRLWKKTSA